jgi:hypothetical protein
MQEDTNDLGLYSNVLIPIIKMLMFMAEARKGTDYVIVSTNDILSVDSCPFHKATLNGF